MKKQISNPNRQTSTEPKCLCLGCFKASKSDQINDEVKIKLFCFHKILA